MNTIVIIYHAKEQVWQVWQQHHYLHGGFTCGGGCFSDFWRALEYLRGVS